METFLNAQPNIELTTLSNGSDTRVIRSDDPMIPELLNQGYYEVRTPSVDVRNMVGPTKGAISNREMELFQQASPVNPAQELQEAIQQLEIQKTQTSDPDEIKSLDRLIEVAIVGANAPLREMSLEMQAQGRGEDTALAHLRPGEVILPPEAFEDAQFEDTVARKFEELGIDPEEAVAGVGIASLNPMTGLEEFGFFKKIGKAIKKVAKFIAPIAGPLANFIPGVGPLVAGAIGAATNVVGGKGLSGAISGGLGGYGFGKALGGIGSLGKAAASTGSATTGGGGFFSKIGKGIASLVSGGGRDNSGSFGMLGDVFTGGGMDKKGSFGYAGDLFTGGFGGGGGQTNSGTATTGGTSFNEPFVGADFSPGAAARGMYPTSNVGGGSSINPFSPVGGGPSFGNAFSGVDMGGIDVNKLSGLDPKLMAALEAGNAASNTGFKLSDIYSGTGINDDGKYGFLGDLGAKLVGGGGGTSGGLGGLGGLAAAGVPAYLLGKMAYDEAKADKGVALTPLTTMGPTGRYNIEAEIARRMGTQAPNPVEFGLLPQGTFPQLSGGQPMMAAGGGAVYPMAYAEGGNVSVEDFERMNGDINGPGTETSDDVPAMLSDGEFVMTGAAVRGAGGFDMQNQGGILTLTPSGTPDRERGTNVMHEMMDLFGSYANAPA